MNTGRTGFFISPVEYATARPTLASPAVPGGGMECEIHPPNIIQKFIRGLPWDANPRVGRGVCRCVGGASDWGNPVLR